MSAVVTPRLMKRVFGGKRSMPVDGECFVELATICVPEDTVISDEAWLAIPIPARLKLMSMYIAGVHDAINNML